MTNLVISGFGPETSSQPVTVLQGGPSGAILEQPIDSDRNYQLTLYGPDGAAVTGFQPTDTLTATMWAGEDQQVLWNPPVSWISAANATIQLSFTAAGLAAAGITPGSYRVQVIVVAGPQTLVAFDGVSRFTAAPGSSTLPPVYCQYSDMKVYAPWLGSLLESTEELTGFAAERGRARQWLDDLIARNYRGGVASVFGNDPSGGPGGIWGTRRTFIYSPYILDQLVQNHLIVRPAIVEATAKYAVGLVLQAQLGRGPTSDFARLADRFLADAHNSAVCLTCEIDTNNDGIGDIAVLLGTTNSFWA